MGELAPLADQVGVSERTLRRAISQGALHAVRPTPRTLELALGERDFVRRRWSLLSVLRSLLRTEHNVRFALLFGSTAVGRDGPASDIDLLVGLRDERLERLADLTEKLARACGRPIDLVRLADAESDPAFLVHTMAVGRVLVDRDGDWARLRASEPTLRARGAEREHGRAGRALAGIDRLLSARP